MALHNPKNWHWVTKDASAWTRQWLEDDLTKLQVEGGDVKARITKVQSMDGDVDVSQRKGKVITIFDVKLVLEYSGTTADGLEVSGNITVPEIAHDTDEDEYVFDIDIFSESKEKQPVKDLVKSKLVPLLRKEFQKLAGVLIAEHGKDIQHAPGSAPSSGFSTPRTMPQASNVKPAAPTVSHTTSTGGVVNTLTVTDTAEFRTTAEEIFKTFTSAERLAAFTRSQPSLLEDAKEGGSFRLFDGNVTGVYLELTQPARIVQTWRLNQWPAGHHSTLEIDFDQNDVDHVTVMRVTWKGVPVGQEEVTKRNWSEYYVRGIKQTFGFGTIL